MRIEYIVVCMSKTSQELVHRRREVTLTVNTLTLNTISNADQVSKQKIRSFMKGSAGDIDDFRTD